MSAQNRVDEKSKRRRGLREEQPEEVVDAVEEDIEDEAAEDEGSSSRAITPKKGRATPSRRRPDEEEEEVRGNFITRPFYVLGEYFEGVRSEMAKVVWPTREDARRLTGIVITTIILSSIVLGVLSLIFSQIFSIGLRAPVIFAFVFAIAIGAFVLYLRQSNRRPGGY
jgi:preprotein translocase subunit SecE